MPLIVHPDSSEMIYDLQQELKETFKKGLCDVTGTDAVESLADTFFLSNPGNHFVVFLPLAIVIPVLTEITLLALKCILPYLCKIIK